MIGLSALAPNDGQTFQVISGLLTGFAGAFFMRIKAPDKSTDKSTTTSEDTKEKGVGEEEKKSPPPKPTP